MRNRKRTAETMTTEALPRKRWHGALRWTALGVALLAGGGVARAQGGPSASPVPVTLTLKRTVEMALANSRDIRAARMQASLAQQSADVATRFEVMASYTSQMAAIWPMREIWSPFRPWA